MYALKANFRPVAEQTENGPIGYADITIANALRLNQISVFEKDGKRSLAFDTFGKEEKKHSYVVPSSPEAYAAMLGVVEKAIENEDHFAVEQGSYNVRFEVKGVRVDEPYADGRYMVGVGDLCVLNGISTHVGHYEKDGKEKSFVSVDMPVVRNADGDVSKWTDKEGKERVNYQFTALVNKWTDKENKEHKTDYAQRLNRLIRAKRKELAEPTLDDQIAAGKAAQAAAPEKDAAAQAKNNDERLPH